MKNTSLILGIGLLLTLSGCQDTPEVQPSETPVDTEPVSIANPASENCVTKSGRIEMRQNKKGEYGVCLFEDNRQCEEWALMRGDCPVGGLKITGYENDAQIYCAITGGQVEGVGTDTPMCKRIDGTLCNAQANLDGDCPDPADPNPSAGNVEVSGDNSDYVFDMADISKSYNPMTGEAGSIGSEEQMIRTDFYNYLRNDNATGAVALLETNFKLESIFPEIGNAEPVRLAIPFRNGILLLIFAGNGYPSVPNDSFYFGFISAVENQIRLHRSLVTSYFDNPLGVTYKTSLDNNDSLKAVEILDQIEAETKQGIETGTFSHATVQTEYDKFVSEL